MGEPGFLKRGVPVMRKMLAYLLLAVVVAAGVGFYLGWLGFSTASDPDGGRTVVQLSIGRPR